MQVNYRLFEIVYLLMQKGKMTAKELAKRFEVSTRTIYRDIEILSSANIPIYATKGKEGGIGLLEEYVLNKTILSEEEQNQILFALQGMKKVRGQEEKDILEKLSILFHKKVQEWIKIDLSNWGKESPQQGNVEKIKSAILNQQLIQFVYYNSNGEETKRMVEPLQIWFKDKSWYLIGYCRVKEDYRIFKISRMKEMNLLEENFKKEMAYRVYDEFEKEEITKKEDGNFFVKVEYPENEWIYSYLLSYGEYVKVLSPNRLKDEMKNKLQKMLENYS